MTRVAPARRPIFVCDLARGVAALAVLFAHARGFVFADLPLQPDLPMSGKLFFGLTALGHQAVVVFLVLSGVLVTGSALDALRAGRWLPGDFALARLVRLWTVLLPCLVIGGIEDAIRHWWAGGAMFDGSALDATVAATVERLDWLTFVGNAAFLQGFVTPVFGSNVPLWTLAIEAWCYAGLLAAVCAWTRRREPGRLVISLVVVLPPVVLILPPTFWAVCPIWCVGAVLAYRLRADDRGHGDGARGPADPGRWTTPRLAVAVVASALVVVSARVLAARHLAISDYLLGILAAAGLAVAHEWEPSRRALRRAVRAVAGFSYTLYLAHFPLLALVDTLVLHHRPLAWGGAGLVLWCAVVAVALVQTVALWWLFERHTGAVRATVATWIGSRRPRGAARAVLP